MNLLLFPEQSPSYVLSARDPRTHHIRKILRMGAGDVLAIGAANGPRGKARISDGEDGGLILEAKWASEPPAPVTPLTLLVGLPRPQTARKILKDATSLGLARFLFFRAEKGEASYIDSKLWNTDEWRRHLIEGAEQAFATQIPAVEHCGSLANAIERLDADGSRAALDVYEGQSAFADASLRAPLTLAIGSERGWSASERDTLRANGFSLYHLGERVLRTETAVISGLTLAASKLGFLR